MKSFSNELNLDLISKDCVKKQNFIDSVNTNKSEKTKQLLVNEPGKSFSSECEFEVSSATSNISREDIVARRKLKVKDARQKKKLDKQPPLPLPVASDFVLNSTLEDYPDLSTARNFKKKVRNNQFASESEIFNNNEEGSGRNRLTEKSWKPKVKDPISIDIYQALQTKSEVSEYCSHCTT